MAVEGSCHCGKIAFVAEGAPEQAMECNCSHCQRKGFLLWFTTPDKFTVTGDEASMTTYQFNKHNIEHKFCAVCGAQPFARGKTPDRRDMVAVNLRCAPDFDRSGVTIVPVDGKSF
jgi:hypothetical protein